MKVDFIKLNPQYRLAKKEIDNGLRSVIKKGNFILGKEVNELEESFAKYCGCKYGVGVNSGTDALFLSLVSLGVGKGDEVIVPAFTFIATALVVSYTGARVVFVDIEDKTYNIDVEKVKRAITKKTKAIIPVHLFGQPADMTELRSIAKKHNLKIIEDAAQAHGAGYKGERCGSLGDVGCFSFYPTKNLSAFGDGGMVVTQDKKIYEKLLMLRDCGRRGRYEHVIKGYNSRLDTIQAVIIKAKIKYLDQWNKRRQAVARTYSQFLSKNKNIVTPSVKNDRSHVYNVYAIRVKNRDRVYERLRQNNIGALIHYSLPLHLQKAYRELGYHRGDFPVAEKISQEILSLPMHPFLKRAEIEYVARQVLRATGN